MPGPQLEIELSSNATRAWREARDRADAGPHLGDGWVAYRRGRGLTPRYLLLRRPGGEVDSVGLAFLARPKLRPWIRPKAELDRLPVALQPDRDGGEPATERARALVEFARRRWLTLSIDSFGGPTPPPELAESGFATRDRFEFTVDLRGDEEALWSAIKSSHRRKIRKAEKAGVEFEVRDDAAAELAALQQFTSDRRAARGEDMQGLSEQRFRALTDALRADGGGGLSVVGSLDGRVVSAMLIACHGRHAYYLLGGTDAVGLAANAASRVFVEAMRTLRDRGIEFLNLGGTPADAADPESPAHGLYRFKVGWGALPAPCRSGSWQADPAEGPKSP